MYFAAPTEEVSRGGRDKTMMVMVMVGECGEGGEEIEGGMSLLSWCEMDDSAWCTSVPRITMGDRRVFLFFPFSFFV